MDPLDGYPAMMSTQQVGEYLNISTVTLKAWRGEGKGPHCVMIGNSVRYPRESLRAYAAAHPVVPAVS